MSGHPEYPKPAPIFGAPFPQDWDAEGDDRPDLVRNSARGTPTAELLATAAGAVAVASAGATDEGSGRRADCESGRFDDAHPEADGSGFQPWFGQTAGPLRELARRAEPGAAPDRGGP